MPRFSANIGFLWPELALCERIRRAAAVGFEAVECHFPYDTDPALTAAALAETGLEMQSLNTRLGINGPEDFGVAARPDRVDEARGYINEAIAYAAVIGCKHINVVPGRTGRADGTEETYRANLTYACEKAADLGCGVLVEPINTRAAPDFHISLIEEAIDTITAVDRSNLSLMFDCFHVQLMQGDLHRRLTDVMPWLGHVQISAVPDRGEPDTGEINYPWLLGALDNLGWEGFVGAEYRPRGTTDDGLGWLASYQQGQTA